MKDFLKRVFRWKEYKQDIERKVSNRVWENCQRVREEAKVQLLHMVEESGYKMDIINRVIACPHMDLRKLYTDIANIFDEISFLDFEIPIAGYQTSLDFEIVMLNHWSLQMANGDRHFSGEIVR